MSEQRGGFNIVRWSVDHPYTVVAFFLAMLVTLALIVTFPQIAMWLVGMSQAK